MKELKFDQSASEIIEKLQKGAFLTVKDNDGNLNTMTISWGNIGYMWRKPIFTVMVRYSRHTYQLIQRAQDFTLSIPKENELKKELEICGTKSGRDINKFKECNFSLINAQKVNTPIIDKCNLHLECKIVYKQAMNEDGIVSDDIISLYGAEKDYHVLYYGEIVACYKN